MGLFDSVGRALGDAARGAGQVFAESLRQSEPQLYFDDGSATVTYRTVDETRLLEAEMKNALELKMTAESK